MDQSLIFLGFDRMMSFSGVCLKSASSLLEVIIDEVTEEVESKMSDSILSRCGYLVPIEVSIHKLSVEGNKTVAVVTYAFCCNSKEDFRKLKLLFSEKSIAKLKECLGTDNACHYKNMNFEFLSKQFVSENVIKVDYGSDLKIKNPDYKRYYNIKTKKAGKTLDSVRESE